MSSQAPKKIAIDHDNYHAKHIGWTSDGRQFFLTTPFEPGGLGRQGNEFVALYLFDSNGILLEAIIDEFGPRDTMDEEKRRRVYEQRLTDLGQVTFQRIEIAPFSIGRFGTTLGLIPQPPEEDGDEWSVELHPGNVMAFFEPWDSGDYDT